MKETQIASRYAKSFLLLALSEGKQDEAFNDMLMLSDACANSRDLSLLLKSPIIKVDKKTEIFKKLFSEHMNTLSLSFIELIIKKRRENYLQGISTEFTRQYKKYKNILTVDIVSVNELEDRKSVV